MFEATDIGVWSQRSTSYTTADCILILRITINWQWGQLYWKRENLIRYYFLWSLKALLPNFLLDSMNRLRDTSNLWSDLSVLMSSVFRYDPGVVPASQLQIVLQRRRSGGFTRYACKTMREFVYDPTDNNTFACWYARYDKLFRTSWWLFKSKVIATESFHKSLW